MRRRGGGLPNKEEPSSPLCILSTLNQADCDYMARDSKVRADLAARRREIVARYRLRQLTVREITEQLASKHPEIVNPKTLKPFSRNIVHLDLKALDKEWRARAAEAIDAHQARVLAEIAEIKRQGWTDRDMGVVIKALGKECDVLGLNAATLKLAGDPTSPIASRVEVVFVGPPDEEESDRAAEVDAPG